MNTEKIVHILTRTGAEEALIKRYRQYQAEENRKGQERILCRCRSAQNEKLQEKREQLQCLDYMIAKVEKDHE